MYIDVRGYCLPIPWRVAGGESLFDLPDPSCEDQLFPASTPDIPCYVMGTAHASSRECIMFWKCDEGALFFGPRKTIVFSRHLCRIHFAPRGRQARRDKTAQRGDVTDYSSIHRCVPNPIQSDLFSSDGNLRSPRVQLRTKLSQNTNGTSRRFIYQVRWRKLKG